MTEDASVSVECAWLTPSFTLSGNQRHRQTWDGASGSWDESSYQELSPP